MAEVIDFSKANRPDMSKRTFKLSLVGLSLAVQYFHDDEAFRKEAMSSIRRCKDCICMVEQHIHDRVMKSMDAADAVKKVLYSN